MLSWSKVKALVAHVTPENVAGWIRKAHAMSSNALEHEIAKQRDPVIGERMVPMYVPEHALAWFRELLCRKQADPRERNLNDGEFFYRMLDLMQASMDDPATAPPALGPVLPVPHSPDRSRHIPAAVQEAALKRARYRCERCGNRLAIVFHHAVIPFAEGGPHTLANIEVWCGRCHDAEHREERAADQLAKGALARAGRRSRCAESRSAGASSLRRCPRPRQVLLPRCQRVRRREIPDAAVHPLGVGDARAGDRRCHRRREVVPHAIGPVADPIVSVAARSRDAPVRPVVSSGRPVLQLGSLGPLLMRKLAPRRESARRWWPTS